MTYEEFSRHIQERYEAHSGRPLPENELDELVVLVHELPCIAGTIRETHFWPKRGPVEYIRPCPHCAFLTHLEREKSKLKAKRNASS